MPTSVIYLYCHTLARPVALPYLFSQETPANRVPKSPRNSGRLTSGCFWWLRNIQPSHTSVAMGAFAGGGGILRQARPDSRREILLVAAFYGRARKATAQF